MQIRGSTSTRNGRLSAALARVFLCHGDLCIDFSGQFAKCDSRIVISNGMGQPSDPTRFLAELSYVSFVIHLSSAPNPELFLLLKRVLQGQNTARLVKKPL